MEPKRLNKYISDAGFCSRREADKLIEEERVTINGRLADAGAKVMPKDKVRIDDEILNVREEAPVFMIFNKPANMSATADMSVRDNVVRAINHPASLQPILHLERDADGLIFLSNDTDLVARMTRFNNKYEKEYIVTVNKLITSEFLLKLSGSEPNESGEQVQRTFVAKEGSNRLRIILKPSANHNIKMMCEDLGYQVTHLSRIRIENFTLAKLPAGHWRALNPAEVENLRSVTNRAGAKSKERDFEQKKRSTTTRSGEGSQTGARIGKSRPKTPAKGGAGSFSRSSTGSSKGAPKGGNRTGGFKSGGAKGGAAGKSGGKGPAKRGR
ncbi:S4 domain-containing protein [Pontibacter rugosus]|uniref:S4 domain-containing protein n=1 Tax=Pontibacter rugosus TaxID=1745966 RepID=A0ABW3SKC7_9BACT